ncbi:hypothetical protein OG978_33565 [Streptomyces sp. NBC_01591]|uniref:DNA polymerase III subunit beta family protein n=1 Tax=Streptomyces sp. NBC_01591 TaxID=2975888 RepID=UPI002DDBFD85|nr:hypothetical protein [Streptomyces sp. NBC_01591]WSD71890.1 hypothetical protein OG978_33565 [Streptomyces sp. NBC_01591]
MSVTINAHQLGRLIDKVRGHIGDEYVEVLHGIRLDVDATDLHAVATDRFTIAAARYRLNDDDKNGEAFARTIPASWLKPLREWLDAQEGNLTVTIGTETSRLVFATPHAEMRVPVSDSLEYPDWRSLLRGVAANIPTIYALPIVDSRMLARWADAGDALRVRVTTDLKAFMVFGKDFIGAQAPKRYTGVGPCEDETFEQALGLWPSIFADSDEVADMDADMPVEEKPRYEAASTIPDMVESLLQQTLRSTSDLLGAPSKDAGAIASYATAGVNAWSAYRFLAALHQADPRLAAQTVAELGEELDAGDFGENAWDIAKAAGHDPQKWSDDYEAHLKKLAEKRATKQNAA